ncbi:NAD(P)-dependent alcohol dehydrogenase [Marivirga arenosa]|uniref:NAD(P)-dependent alcohol dehydrogenase n=1 Tax=Marivirga arenosa TaxID=3059076 RepID=A0AA49GJR4_9BACT|nr:NAD(P)-dependent alcohol dehydrogenase [Marivirga sp. BKB1-2]WKK82677.2 NAD(P)-dependent alcohol dehydrogenase [Marivirga sp. BKB1-2]
MKAVLFDRKNPYQKFQIHEVPKPNIRDDEVLVKVHCASPNAADYRSIQMRIVPKHNILGSAISGIVEEVGKGISQFKVGDEVIADLADVGMGGFAEFKATKTSVLVHKPKGVSFEEAAALPVAATTALQALRKGGISKGEKVLIIGSAGGVGTFALQLAKYFETDVTAVCSTKSVEQSYNFGADKVIDYMQEDLFNRDDRYDLILAINGNYPLLKCKQMLSKSGQYIAVGGSLKQIFKALLFGKILSFGKKKIKAVAAKPFSEDLAFVADLVEKGKIKPSIEKVYKMEQTDLAMEYLSAGHAKAKVLISFLPVMR